MAARLKALTPVLAVLSALFLLSTVNAANSVRLLDNLDDGSTQMTVLSSTQSKVELEIGVDALKLSPTDEWGQTYTRAELPEGDCLVPGVASEVGDPEVPVLSTMIAIPDNAGVSANVTYGGYEIFEF